MKKHWSFTCVEFRQAMILYRGMCLLFSPPHGWMLVCLYCCVYNVLHVLVMYSGISEVLPLFLCEFYFSFQGTILLFSWMHHFLNRKNFWTVRNYIFSSTKNKLSDNILGGYTIFSMCFTWVVKYSSLIHVHSHFWFSLIKKT